MNIPLKFGLILGLSYCAWTILMYITGLDTTRIDVGHYGDYLVTILPVSVLYLSIRAKRTTLVGEPLRYVDAVKTGIVVSLIAWIIYTPFLVLYHHLINPEWLDYVIEFQKQTMTEANMAAAEIDQRVEQIRAGSTDIMHAVNGLIFGVVVMGFLISSISFVLLRSGKAVPQTSGDKI